MDEYRKKIQRFVVGLLMERIPVWYLILAGGALQILKQAFTT